MKKIFLLIYMFISLTGLHAAPVIIYNTENGRVIEFKQKAHTPEYVGRTDVVIYNVANPDLPQCAMQYWIVDNGTVREMTTAEKAVIDAEIAEHLAQIEADKKNLDKQEKMMRACILVLVNEVNRARQWDTDLKAVIAASTSLADFKTRAAALSDRPQITAAQANTAIKNKYDEL